MSETYFTKISKKTAEELSFLTKLDHENILGDLKNIAINKM